MKIVIDIPEEYYNVLKSIDDEKCYMDMLLIKHGTPYEERKTGKWIVEKDCEGKTRTLICPFCKWKSGQYAWENYNFCPNCGAKMEVDE